MVQRKHKFGLDANRPIVVETGAKLGAPSEAVADPQAIAESGAAWVRVNFVLGPWLGPRDMARFQGRTWAETYAAIIDRFRDAGLNIYGLIGHEAVSPLPDFFRDPRQQMPSGDIVAARGWIARYAQNFADIVALFAGRVTVFEVFNEPDDWHGAFRPWVHPTWCAEMLESVYREVKVRLGARQVRLISGPLQGLEVNENRAPTQYLREIYEYGRQYLGWGQPDRPYPFDGVGYHLYVKEAYNPDWALHEYQVRQIYRRYVDGMMRVMRAAEGPNSTKQLYLSEIGWPSNRDTPEEKAFQARNLRLAFELLQGDAAVALAIWFCTEDFDPGRRHYGLYQMRRVTPDGRKPAFHTFRAFCERFGAAAIYGSLRDQAGGAQSGYQIMLTPLAPRPPATTAVVPYLRKGGDHRASSVAASAITGPDGAFRFDGLPSGIYTLSVVGASLTREVACDDTSEAMANLVLPLVQPPQQGVIAGALLDQAGTPRPGRQITLSGVGRTLSVNADPGGGYRFEGLAAGAYVLRVGGADLEQHVWSNGITTVALDLTQAVASPANQGVISGTLRDRFGAPQATRPIILTGATLARAVAADGAGRYRFEGLPAGPYAIHVEGSDLSQSVYCDGRAPVLLDLILPEATSPGHGVVSGVLRDHGGTALGGRSIVIELLSAGLARSVNSDNRGLYRFDGLPAGSYRLSVTGADVVRTLWTDGVAPVRADLALKAPAAPAGLGSISGVLRDETGRPQAAHSINLVGGGVSHSTLSDASGFYCFEGLASGTYLLSVAASGLTRYIVSDGQASVRLDLAVAADAGRGSPLYPQGG